jgi:fatty acid desaturase
MFPAVGGFTLVASQQAPAVGSVGSSHAFWYGVLLALFVSWFFPGWARVVLFVIALLALHVIQSLIGHAGSHSSSGSSSALILLLIVVGLVALVGGLVLGRMRGLRQLGVSEYQTRFERVRDISSWF